MKRALYFSHEQLILEISRLPGVTTFYHYLLYRSQTMSPHDQFFVEAFVDYCTLVYNMTHKDDPVGTDEVLTTLFQLTNLDRQHLEKLALLQVGR